MAVILTPILKSSMSDKLKSLNTSTSRVTFNLPSENESIITYLRTCDELSYESKLSSVVKSISSPDTEDSVLLGWITEFKDNILFLDKENECITFALLNLNWCNRHQRFVAVYQEFILNLVTANTSYLRIVLSMIIRNFLPVVDSNEDITDEERTRFQNVHTLLKYIIELVPLSPYSLCAMLSEKFPYMKSPVHRLHCYIENFLNVCSYLPSKRSTILERIVEMMIHIDVNCSRDIIEICEAQKEEENLLLEDQQMDDKLLLEKKDNMAYPLAHTLDVLMNCLFEYVHNVCFSSDELKWDAAKKLYKEMLTVFDKVILPTHGSCHVQYLMFYICSLKQELCDGFLDYLWKKVQNPNIAPVFRQLATFYIGSLLSRAKYINLSTLTACLDLMCNWIHRYIDNHAVQDLNVHSTFHSVCQAVFYATSFRCSELVELPNGHKFIRSLNFDRIVTCRLNPLRYCDKNIVQNFANISRNFQIAYVYPVIERNNRALLYASLEQSAENASGAVIQTFFPFDPYLLKRSKHWIESLYRIFSHVHKDDEMDQVDDLPADDISPFLCGGLQKRNVLN